MKRISVFLCGLFLLMMVTGSANAALTTIGTAQFKSTGTAYNLIWDDNNNGKSLVWLDYTKGGNWIEADEWTRSLNYHGALYYSINKAYTVTWTDSWRLPWTVDGEISQYGHDGNTLAGWNITTSEMGHLFYTELGNLGYSSIDGVRPQAGYGLKNTGDFKYLVMNWNWSQTYHYATDPRQEGLWGFHMNEGHQIPLNSSQPYYGLAVREARVTRLISTVPVPGAFWLLGSGLVGLVGLARKR